MNDEAAARFGKHLRRLRQERHLGVRELARKAGVDAGGLTRLEGGRFSPEPETLKALGVAMDVPFADLFAMAGYITPSELPSMSTYLRTCYGDLPDTALASIDEYIHWLVSKHGLDANGPAPFEDETEKPPRR
ncbi:helix-turn-helix domain-containing protein [Streptomyces scabiei]|uniref:helix-turn-helix domain-containing protein n=1 Tax=Streptomyces scabiei TaxID=1930 RepID=UPI0038F79FA6